MSYSRWSGLSFAFLLVAATAVGLSGAQAQPRIQPPSTPNPPAAPPASSTGGAGFTEGITPEQTAEALRAAGYTKVQQYTSQNGGKHAAGETEGLMISVIHQNCKEGGSPCRTISFSADFGKQDTVDAKFMNAWNAQRLYGVIFQRADGSIGFRWALYLEGSSMAAVQRTAAMFSIALRDLKAFKPE